MKHRQLGSTAIEETASKQDLTGFNRKPRRSPSACCRHRWIAADIQQIASRFAAAAAENAEFRAVGMIEFYGRERVGEARAQFELRVVGQKRAGEYGGRRRALAFHDHAAGRAHHVVGAFVQDAPAVDGDFGHVDARIHLGKDHQRRMIVQHRARWLRGRRAAHSPRACLRRYRPSASGRRRRAGIRSRRAISCRRAFRRSCRPAFFVVRDRRANDRG